MDFIGIDVGTSGCKASVISETGGVLKSARREYKLSGGQSGFAALSLTAVWSSVKAVLKELAPAAAGVRAAMVSSLGETLALVDKNGQLLLDDGITYMDRRNTEVWNLLKHRIPREELYLTTGKTEPQIAAVNQYTYWKETRPEIFEKTDRLFFVDSYIAYLLCGEAMIDYSAASNTMCFDINSYEWSGSIAKRYEMDLRLFPQIGRAGTRLGPVRKKWREELGLPADMEILAGCHDQISAAVGGGAVRPGDAVLGEGSTEALNLLTDRKGAERIRQARLPMEPFVKKGRYVSLLSRLMHGNCLKWFIRNFAVALSDKCEKEGGSVYDDLNRNCAGISGGIVFLPYLSSTCFADIGQPMGSFIGMDAGSTVYHLYRGMLEGLCCESAEMFQLLEDYGIPADGVTAVGGVSRSDVYMQMKADITRKEIEVLKHGEAGVRGLAMLCAVEFGCYSSLEEACLQFREILCRYVPGQDSSGILERHRRLSEAVKSAYSGLHY